MGQPAEEHHSGSGWEQSQLSEIGPAGVPIPQATGLSGADTVPPSVGSFCFAIEKARP